MLEHTVRDHGRRDAGSRSQVRRDNWDTQWWNYDRRTGIVRNPWANKCLDVKWSDTAYGAPVWTWDCSPAEVNNPAQRWPWNPETSHLVSALSPDLVLGAASATDGSSVSTAQISYNPEFNRGLLWHAD